MPDNDWRATMYGPEPEEELTLGDGSPETAIARPAGPTDPERQQLTVAVRNQTVTLVVDGKPVVVPSMAFVQALQKENEEQARAIRRLESQVKQLRMAVNSHSNEFDDVQRQLDRKVNLRD